ncbi:hypothetical protein [Nonomuraea typhae]|uniref:hypothetical protein n=1 Tax=Nonomuraea typhae TaxID=2603600 RepID=UPI0012F9EBD2|nr:hypothetical protein [Nonomuraea typhae]
MSTTTGSESLKSVTTALEYARAYEQVAAFLAANPDLAKRASVYLGRYTNIVPPTAADPVEFILDAARRGRAFGAQVKEWVDGNHGGVKIGFGPLHVKVYTTVDKVCRKVVVGMVEDVQYALAFDLDGTPRTPAEAAS